MSNYYDSHYYGFSSNAYSPSFTSYDTRYTKFKCYKDATPFQGEVTLPESHTPMATPPSFVKLEHRNFIAKPDDTKLRSVEYDAMVLRAQENHYKARMAATKNETPSVGQIPKTPILGSKEDARPGEVFQRPFDSRRTALGQKNKNLLISAAARLEKGAENAAAFEAKKEVAWYDGKVKPMGAAGNRDNANHTPAVSHQPERKFQTQNVTPVAGKHIDPRLEKRHGGASNKSSQHIGIPLTTSRNVVAESPLKIVTTGASGSQSHSGGKYTIKCPPKKDETNTTKPRATSAYRTRESITLQENKKNVTFIEMRLLPPILVEPSRTTVDTEIKVPTTTPSPSHGPIEPAEHLGPWDASSYRRHKTQAAALAAYRYALCHELDLKMENTIPSTTTMPVAAHDAAVVTATHHTLGSHKVATPENADKPGSNNKLVIPNTEVQNRTPAIMGTEVKKNGESQDLRWGTSSRNIIARLQTKKPTIIEQAIEV